MGCGWCILEAKKPWEGLGIPWSLLGSRSHHGIIISNSVELNWCLPFISIFPSL